MLVATALLATATAVVSADSTSGEHSRRPWMNKADPPAARAKKLVAEMKMEEKLVMLHGPISPMPCCECFNKTTGKIVDKGCAYTGNVVPNERLGIPPIHMNGELGTALVHALIVPLHLALKSVLPSLQMAHRVGHTHAVCTSVNGRCG